MFTSFCGSSPHPGRGAINCAPTRVGEAFRVDKERPTLGQVVRYFKAMVTRRVRQAGYAFAWQRNYFEHIIRSERALRAVRRYIRYNPLRWEVDRYNPQATGPDLEARRLWEVLRRSGPGPKGLVRTRG